MRCGRRQVLGMTGAVAVLATLPTTVAQAAARTADQERILSQLTEAYAGNDTTNADPTVKLKVTAIQATAQAAMNTFNTLAQADTSNVLFRGITSTATEVIYVTEYTNLAAIALATVTPGAAFFARSDIQQRVIDALQWHYDRHFSKTSAGYVGNWFQWEIGMPTVITRSLVLLRDVVAAYKPDLTSDFVATMDNYLRGGDRATVIGDVDLASRFHTGANLVDITTNRILQGALLGDDARITKAVSNQLTAYNRIDRANLVNNVTDGFYPDGSFVQHDSVAYTGSYGKILLAKVMLTIKVLAQTPYLAGRDLTGTVQDWVAGSFAPVIYEGYLMEIVKGRGVSRTTTGYTDVVGIIESATDLSRFRPAADAAKLRSWVKFVTRSSKSTVAATSFVSPATIAAWAALMTDTALPATDTFRRAQSTFNAMERDVHVGDGYAFALARTSERISKYEYMSNENLKPWFQGDGAYYLYLAGDDQTTAYGASYYALVDPTRLAGVTAPVEDRTPVPGLYGVAWYDNPDAGFTSSSVSQNTYIYFPKSTDAWSGGTSLGSYGIAGLRLSSEVTWRDKQAGRLPQDLVAYQGTAGVKTYVMLGDKIVVLTAGVTDPAGREVTTTVDSRTSAPSATVTLLGQRRDGVPTTGDVTSTPMSWLRWYDAARGKAVGYVFLDKHPVSASVKPTSANLRSVRVSNPNTVVSSKLAWVGYSTPASSQPDSCAYVIVPGSTADLNVVSHQIEIVANTASVQAVTDRSLLLTGANFFAPDGGKAGRIKSSGPATVLLQENNDRTVTLSVSDPTQKATALSVEIHVPWLSLVYADPGVRPAFGKTSSVISYDVATSYGKTFTATFRRK